MILVQPQLLNDPAELARSLVAQLNRSRSPALFKDEPFGVSRHRLLVLAESWISAGYRLDSWSMRDELETSLRSVRIGLAQSRNKPINTTITWSGQLDDVVTGVSDDEYKPPTDETTEAETEEQEEIAEYVAQQRATEIFLAFIQTLFFDKIRRCARCKRFFLNTSGHRNKQFCSSRCARITSAMRSKDRVQERFAEDDPGSAAGRALLISWPM